ncbi:MAG TPA: DNA-formamidopyrimidine glycosylase [Spirochaetales bacterium]|nr:DNA-formamidopyrimidine glycosylase [Spirochaetales bacterium]
MPELPDLVYIEKRLKSDLAERKIARVEVKQPIVIRVMLRQSFEEALSSKQIKAVERHGPFLKISINSLQMIIHFMLSGRFQLQEPATKRIGNICFTLYLDNALALHYSDNKKMGRVYLIEENRYEQIPGYTEQGVDILSRDFTFERFAKLIEKKRNQVRVFIMDQRSLSAIGNGYADEILFAAGIHPKTLCSQLSESDIERLYNSIKEVINWGITEVARAAEPVEVKVRGHMKVRNRKGRTCTLCGATIRRVGVLGYDAFFCPRCQPPLREQFINWT